MRRREESSNIPHKCKYLSVCVRVCVSLLRSVCMAHCAPAALLTGSMWMCVYAWTAVEHMKEIKVRFRLRPPSVFFLTPTSFLCYMQSPVTRPSGVNVSLSPPAFPSTLPFSSKMQSTMQRTACKHKQWTELQMFVRDMWECNIHILLQPGANRRSTRSGVRVCMCALS